MQGIYTVIYEGTVSTAAQLIELATPSGKSAEILRATITQSGTTTDDNAEALLYRYTSAASGGAAGTEVKHNPNSPTAGVTASIYDGSWIAEGSTSIENIILEGFSVLAGWTWLPTPEERIWVPPSSYLALKSNIDITSVNIIASITWREV